MTGKLSDLDIDNFIKRYLAGESEWSLARFFNVDRNTIAYHLMKHKIIRRTRSEAARIRMSKLSPEEKKLLTKNANKANRGRITPHEKLVERAKFREQSGQYRGYKDMEMMEWLKQRGLQCRLQFAIDKFNIDLVIPPIAVEIKIGAHRPDRIPLEREKIEYITKCGWTMIHIHTQNPAHITTAHADQIVALYEIACRNPSRLGEYWMLGRNGDVKSFKGAQFNYIT